MSPEARNAHKAKQAAYNKHRLVIRAELLFGKHPRHYNTTYRKTRGHSRLVGGLRFDSIKYVKKKLLLLLQHTKRIYSAYEVYAWKRAMHIEGIGLGKINSKSISLFPRLFGVAKRSQRGVPQNSYTVDASSFVNSTAQVNRLIY